MVSKQLHIFLVKESEKQAESETVLKIQTLFLFDFLYICFSLKYFYGREFWDRRD